MSVQIIKLLVETNKSIYLRDPIEPEKGVKAILNTWYIFNAQIFSYLHGGKNYKLSFDIDDIVYILNYHKNNNQFEKIIDSLVGYLVSNKIDSKVVKEISAKIYEITQNTELKEYFEYQFDMKYLEEHNTPKCQDNFF